MWPSGICSDLLPPRALPPLGLSTHRLLECVLLAEVGSAQHQPHQVGIFPGETGGWCLGNATLAPGSSWQAQHCTPPSPFSSLSETDEGDAVIFLAAPTSPPRPCPAPSRLRKLGAIPDEGALGAICKQDCRSPHLTRLHWTGGRIREEPSA